MLVGISFITVTAGAITSEFVEAARRRRQSTAAGPELAEIRGLREQVTALQNDLGQLRRELRTKRHGVAAHGSRRQDPLTFRRMATPPPVRALILAVDDDPAVGRAIERDLRHRYGARHRVLLADSGEAGLGLVEQIVRRGEPVALLVADQRMPGMTGVEFLARP